jgi:hypothetical protein
MVLQECIRGARGSIVVKALCYKPEGRGFKSRLGHWIFLIDLILPAVLGPGVYSSSKRNVGSKARPARKADNLTSISEPIVKVMWDP